MDMRPLRAAAPPGVRFLERFVPDEQVGALFRRAELAVLPYREIDQSGVLFTARRAAAERYDWAGIARRHLALYARLRAA